MIAGLYTAASGMVAHQAKLDTLANNLANVETPGFKADLLTIDASAAPPSGASPIGSGATIQPGRLVLDPAAGVLKPTGNALDLALDGPGLFVVETPQGERYTRAGNFTRDPEGFLATAQGFRVLGSAGPVRIPEAGLRVGEAGALPDGSRLRVVAGPDGAGLAKIGGNLFAPAPGARPPEDLPAPRVVQGHLEGSNVSPVRAMVEMLATVRSYEAYQKTIQQLDQTAGQAANELGRA
ncbi:MAG: flagellar hook-basal body protein [Candidatus Methylomirabilales bacterium]